MLYEKIIAGAILLLSIYLFLQNFFKKSKGNCSNCSGGNKLNNKKQGIKNGISIIKPTHKDKKNM